MAEPPVAFASLLRKLRGEARLTQEELAEASGVRPRSISDLERGVATSPQRETIRRLADALGLAGLVRAQFEAVARGRAAPVGPEANGVGGAAAATRTLPRDVASFTGRQQKLQELVTAAGEYPAAARALEQALGIMRDLGDRGGEVTALNERGTLHRVSGELAQAEECHQQALDLARAIAGSWDEAHALAGLGRCALATGHPTQAEVLLRQALEIFQRIGTPEATDLLAELDALTGPLPAQ